VAVTSASQLPGARPKPIAKISSPVEEQGPGKVG
jgi:hypothetical protein